MKHEDLKLGMKVRAIESSNVAYGITTKNFNCEGEVVKIGHDSFELKITKHTHKESGVFTVEAQHFEPITGETTDKEGKGDKGIMKIEMKDINIETKARYGDVVLLDNGSKYLIVADYDGGDYRAINLQEMKAHEDYYCDVEDLIQSIENEECANVVRVVKADTLVLKEI